MVIEGVDRYRVMDPLFECVRVAVDHRGETYSPACVQGISGSARRGRSDVTWRRTSASPSLSTRVTGCPRSFRLAS